MMPNLFCSATIFTEFGQKPRPDICVIDLTSGARGRGLTATPSTLVSTLVFFREGADQFLAKRRDLPAVFIKPLDLARIKAFIDPCL